MVRRAGRARSILSVNIDAGSWAQPNGAMNRAVQLEGVSKSFRGHRAVAALDLEVPEGAIYGFIGPNGSGKTTTLRMILRMILPDCGRIEVLGSDRGGASRRDVAYLPEERGLYRKVTVKRQLVYFARIKGMGRSEAARAADFWLERFGLEAWAGRRTDALSKGMTQKVQFAATVLTRPRLIILDEPFSGLDPVNSEILRSIIFELREAGATLLFSTHDMRLAEEMCDRVLMIYRGRKVLDGSVGGIRSRYGRDTLVMDLEDGNNWSPLGIEGVLNYRARAQGFEIQFEGDPQRLLRSALGSGGIRRFEHTYPTLHDIFVRLARPEPEEVATLATGTAYRESEP